MVLSFVWPVTSRIFLYSFILPFSRIHVLSLLLGLAFSSSGKSQRAFSENVKGVSFKNLDHFRGLRIPSSSHTFRYQWTIDPFLVERFGGPDVRRKVFEEALRRLSRTEGKHFEGWYRAHFHFPSGGQLDFDRWITIYKGFFSLPPISDVSPFEWKSILVRLIAAQDKSRRILAASHSMSPFFTKGVEDLSRCLGSALVGFRNDDINRFEKVGGPVLSCLTGFEKMANDESRLSGADLWEEKILAEWIVARLMRKYIPASSERSLWYLNGGKICALSPRCLSQVLETGERPSARLSSRLATIEGREQQVAKGPFWLQHKPVIRTYTLHSKKRKVSFSIVAAKKSRIRLTARRMSSEEAGGGPLLISASGDGKSQRCSPSFSERSELRRTSSLPSRLRGERHRFRGETGSDTQDFYPSWICDLERSGEHRLTLKFALKDEDFRPPAVRSAGTLVGERTEAPVEVSTACLGRACKRLSTRYPILLLHGMAGRPDYFGLVKYWGEIPKTLRKKRLGMDVHVTKSKFIGHSFERAGELFGQVQRVLKRTGASKVHVIAHSQGGLDARVLMGGFGMADKIASLTSVGTPHFGTPLRRHHPVWTGMDFRDHYMQAVFNRRLPYLKEIPQMSYAGRACSFFDLGCHARAEGPWGSVRMLFWLFAGKTGILQGDNDGVVSLKAASWGKLYGVMEADHLGLIWGQPEFDHLGFYESVARGLVELEKASLN